MSKVYLVEQGDCMASIAAQHGFFTRTIWDDPANAELKRKRQDWDALLPGDRVIIPDLREKVVQKASNQRHRFRRKGVPQLFRLRLLDGAQEPRASLDYLLDIEGQRFSGKTDGEGVIEHWIPPKARKGTLKITEEESYQLSLGHIDPLDEKSGASDRLFNLGYLQTDEPDDEKLEDALRHFQRDLKLEESGLLDDDTQKALEAKDNF